MGFRLIGAIGAPEAMARLWKAAGGEAPPLDLPQGLRILALTEARLDALTRLRPGPYAEGFAYLSEALESALRAASADGALAYLEMEYFGGAGTQAAALFAKGERRFHAAKTDLKGPDRPVNRALRGLGVRAAAGEDEFASLGLGELRSFWASEEEE